MTGNTCALRIQTQQETRTVMEIIADEADKAPPLLAWTDPDPRHVALTNDSGRRQDFEPLVQGLPSWPADLRLSEARLFWPDAALHVVVRDAGGSIWTRIEETSGSAFRREAFPVHPIRDRQRFGLPDESLNADLWAIGYRQFGRLVAWRLTTATDEESRNA